MKEELTELFLAAVKDAQRAENLPEVTEQQSKKFRIDKSRGDNHGDLAANVALVLQAYWKISAMDIAQLLLKHMPSSRLIKNIELAKPGFMNIFLSETNFYQVVPDILEQKEKYGHNNLGDGQKVLIEYVSANPTGPLHVGHARNAAYGDSLARLLSVNGYEVTCEYYINDGGRQASLLGLSVWCRYLGLIGESPSLPDTLYQGDYLQQLAESLHKNYRDKLYFPPHEITLNITKEQRRGPPDSYADMLIARASELLHEQWPEIVRFCTTEMLKDIQATLTDFKVTFQNWFSERSMYDDDSVLSSVIHLLEKRGYVEKRDGATWFLSTRFDEEKDRVLIRANGEPTYFAYDIAYHKDKYRRGFDLLINVWGADHHGYKPRLCNAIKALELKEKALDIRMIQLVTLYRGDVQVPMSTRAGSYVTLTALLDEIGCDAARYFYITRRTEQPLDFDLEVATLEDKNNPVYYIQYAHARIHSVFRRMKEKQLTWDKDVALMQLKHLNTEEENTLLALLESYPDMLLNAAKQREPYHVALFLRDLAGNFHSYYNKERMLVDDPQLRHARLVLIAAIAQVLANGLQLLGLSSPTQMSTRTEEERVD